MQSAKPRKYGLKRKKIPEILYYILLFYELKTYT